MPGEVPTPERLREWIRSRRELESVLAQRHRESLRRLETAAAVEALGLAYRAARGLEPPRPTSGLIEQQRWFQRARR